ncbi:hypothetical protein [Timonella sp. A28]|uniref:DUF7937 domain-containing protein n=1 Tax=Timonella sp. A28 TaxID=3442640 RepID=UPI003EC10A1E
MTAQPALSGSTSEMSDPSHPVKKAFRSIPESDYVRDGIAVVVFAMSCALPKEFSLLNAGGTSVWFFISVLIAASALTLPYLARFGLLPQNWTVSKTRAVRLILAVPFIAYFLWVVFSDFRFSGQLSFVGSGIALAAVGVALSAQARASEIGPAHQDLKAAATARLIATGLAVLIIAAYVVSLTYGWTAVSLGFVPGISFTAVVVALASLIVVPVVAVLVKHSAGWRSAVVGLGIFVALSLYFAGGGVRNVTTFDVVGLFPPVFREPGTFELTIGIGGVLLPAFAAVVASPAFSHALNRTSKVEERLDLIAHVLRLLILVAGVIAVTPFLTYVVLSDRYPAVFRDSYIPTAVGIAVIALVVAAAAMWGLRTFNKNPGASRPTIIVVLAVAVIAGIVMNAINISFAPVFAYLLCSLGLPALGVYALIGNRESREYFAQSAGRRTEVNPAVYQWQQPRNEVIASKSASEKASVVRRAAAYGDTPATEQVESTQPTDADQHAGIPDETTVLKRASANSVKGSVEETEVFDTRSLVGGGTNSHGYTQDDALNPNTPAVVLAKIAEVAPELRPALAQNPATYPALIDWLTQIDDPEINKALAKRTK